MNPDRTILNVLQTSPPAMFNMADWVVTIIVVFLLIAGMFFFLSYLPKKFPKRVRRFCFGRRYLNDKQKIAKMKRALRAYANMDMWSYGEGGPFIDNLAYGPQCTCNHAESRTKDLHEFHCKRHESNWDRTYYNIFKIRPAQDGWVLAEDTLKEIEASE